MKREEMTLKALMTAAKAGFDLSVVAGIVTTKGRMPRDVDYLPRLTASVLDTQKAYETALAFLRSMGKAPKEIGGEAVETKVCEWSFVESDGYWSTTCGGAFNIDHGTPTENNMHFCPYCGQVLNEKE